MRQILAVSVFILSSAAYGWAAFYANVNNNSPAYPYDNWATAATSIEEAVTACYAENGYGTIYVTDGVYRISTTIMLTNTYTTIRSMNGPQTTIIDAQANRRGVYIDSTATLRGFTVKNGGKISEGAGVYMDGNGSVISCIIISNTATSHGGGIYLNNGGSLQSSEVAYNHAGIQGGGMKVMLDGDVQACAIYSNTSAQFGGGIFAYRGGHIDNCTISHNYAAAGGGGIRNDTSTGGALLHNSILYYNSPDNYSGAAPHNFTNCCLQPGGAAYTGSGNITKQPLFRGRNAGDYRLAPESPCINAGDTLQFGSATKDPNGHPFTLGFAPDIGAYAFVTPTLYADFSANITDGNVPFNAVFTPVTISSTNTYMTVQWDFDGDGSWDKTGTSLAPVTNQYTQTGCYTVTLYVANADGFKSYRTKPDYITANPTTLCVAPNAYTNIQMAIDAATAGSRILVTDGTYRVTAPLLINKSIILQSFNGADVTTIDGTYPAWTTRLATISSTGVVIDGFTFCRGRASSGGGLHISTNALIRNCTISSNSASAQGGGLYSTGGAIISNCCITMNSANNGGGVYLHGTGQICDSTICSNYASTGGGIFNIYNGAMIERTVVASNSVSSYGGGAYADRGGTYRDCLFFNNRSASGEGGGIYLYNGGVARRCTIISNSANGYGGGISSFSNSCIEECIIYYNSAGSDANFDAHGTSTNYLRTCSIPKPSGSGCITGNPQFADMSTCDFSLQSSSPCIDGGTTNTPESSDLSGIIRPLDGNASGTAFVDLGCFEFANNLADTDRDGLSDYMEISILNSNPRNTDSDQDGLADGTEYTIGTDLLNTDTDADGLSDNYEHNTAGLNPFDSDSDGDGVTDGWEMSNPSGQLSDPTTADADSDGLLDSDEYLYTTLTDSPDTDNDGQSDYDEVIAGTSPLSNTDYFTIDQAIPQTDKIVLQWKGLSNRTYSIHSTEDIISESSWSAIAGYTYLHGTGGTITCTNNITASNAFYRVQVNWNQN